MKTYKMEVTYTVRTTVTAPSEEDAVIEAMERAERKVNAGEVDAKPRIISER